QGARSKGRLPQLLQPIAAFSGTALLRAKLRGLLRDLFFPYQLSCLYFGQTSPEPQPHLCPASVEQDLNRHVLNLSANLRRRLRPMHLELQETVKQGDN